MSLPSHTVSGDQSAGGVLEDVAEVDDLAPGVGDLDADRLLARDRRQDADLGRRERVGEVVLELGDLGHLHARREPQLVAGDVGAGDAADDLGVDAEVAEGLDAACAADLLLPGRVGLGRLAGGALEEARVGHAATRSRVVGDAARGSGPGA